MPKVIGFDPGKITGVAVLTSPPLQVITAFEIKDTDICDWLNDELHTHEPTHVVYEDYLQEMNLDGIDERHFPQATAKICGAIILRCSQLKIPCFRQSRTRKPIGYRYLDSIYVKGKKGAGIHMADAAAHAAYLIREGNSGNGKEYRFFDYLEGRQGSGQGQRWQGRRNSGPFK